MKFMRNNVKISIAFTLLAVLSLSGCKAPPPPMTDDTLVTSEVDGVKFTHRHAVQAPQSFTPVNETYRALYNASVMTSPDFSGKVVRYLENGKPFTVLGEVENHWLAIADPDQEQLIGYVPFKAGVKADLYDATLKSDRPRPRKNAKKVCVDVGGKSKACRNNDTATWILE
ncbi:SH3 domain-containing protein [Erwinia sp. MMLR14_017]|uniref:SH3 domain-containing protein n=1 Tax=Erwinia sp. MMLR14_017 TaxID=3093842 RepID=UPI00298F8F16|nr:SH3 domain-containing protein [Erwinia sp. MMLR14_017]MDW8847386.1 SH3 domain-containing protein [Erwinia sp. MMLR14_017]